MNNIDNINALKLAIGDGIIADEPMSKHTSFRIGGNADLFYQPTSQGALINAVNAANRLCVPYTLIGNGSNLLVGDNGIRGLVICTGDGLSELCIDGCTVSCGAGLLLSRLARMTVQSGLKGLEWAYGIPGCVGGGIAMNAGAYGGEIKNCIKTVTVFDGKDVVTLNVTDADLGYRRSSFCFPKCIVLAAEFELIKDDGTALSLMDEYTARRKAKQPLSFPSAGSTFKRPVGHFAGALIEAAGLKGLSRGGAMVSELHAGFIINTGNATFDDVYGLINEVRERVQKHSGVLLEPEVKIIS